MTRSPDFPARIAVPTRLEDVRRLAEHLRAACTTAGIDEMIAFDCELALVEAANNIVEHGYAGKPEGEMSLAVTFADKALTMELVDAGASLPCDQFSQREMVPLDATSGRGTAIILSCIDDVTYASEHGINRLVLIKRLG